MRTETALREDIWTELIDRDLDLLLEGKQPFNDDLAPLESFVNSLANFGATSPSPDLIEYHAAEAAAAASVRQSAVAGTGLTPGRRLAFGLKRRATAAATSLMMIVGMTGVAWASDSAVPGDWNYGIDRALESMGIGAGGAEERLHELAYIREEGHPGGAESVSQTGQNNAAASDARVFGLENAATAVVESTQENQLINQGANEVREAVSALLTYLADTEAADRPSISELAQQFKQADGPAESNRPEVNPGDGHRPEDPGKPTSAGRP